MYKLAKPLFMLCETPLHAGSGSDLGVIDLPIQRERHTGFPKVEASGIKGCIRDSFEKMEVLKLNGTELEPNSFRNAIDLIFGPENGNEYASALGFSDARILLFPVKSMKGVFAWVTCPKVLEKFKTDLQFCNINMGFDLPSENSTPKGSKLFIKENKIILEEYLFEAAEDENCGKLAKWLVRNFFPDNDEYQYSREKLATNLVVLPDDDFRDFVTLSTEVITRTKISPETGTVESGALFTEEYLPSETVLYSLAFASPIFSENVEHKKLFDQEERSVMGFFQTNIPKVIQLGGNSTIGKGIVRVGVYSDAK